MKTGIKRVLCLLCAMCMLVFAMTACGGDKDKDNNNSTASQTPSAGGSSNGTVSFNEAEVDPDSIYADPNWSPYATISDSIKGKTVRFATWIDHTATEGAVPLANFEADTGLKVELYTVTQFGYVNALMTKMASGDIPDVFVSNEGDGDFPMTLQIAAPINKVSTVDLNDPIWDKTMLATGTIEGNVYLVNTIGSPWSGSNLVYYNKRLFEENGFKTPAEYYKEGTWTWDNLLKCVKDIKALGADYKGVMIESDILTGSLGTSFVKYDYKTGTFSSGVNDKALLEGYQWYAEAREQNLLDGSLAAFNQGKCGIVVRGVYGLKNTGYFMDMDPEDVGFTYLPSMEEGEKGKISSIYRMYGIIDGAPNADAAGYFIRYWLDPKNYDLDNTFLTVDAGNFYYELTNTVADQKYFCYDKACAVLSGETEKAFMSPARSASSAGVKTAIDSVSNKVDKAVTEANNIVQKKLAADRIKYN